MTEYELVVLTRIITALVALALFGIVCYCFGKSKAEIFPDDDIDNIDAALDEARSLGYEEGYRAGFRAARSLDVHQWRAVTHVDNRRDEDA